ncbi:hypothetical protein ACFL3T_00240 [Patescibacteria group bacterium]
MYKKLLKIGLTIIIALSLGSSAAYAQNLPDVPDPNNLKVDEQCFDQWESFVSSVISYDSFTEFWKDIFVRYNKNLCHYMDISSILDQIDATRQQIKKNFLTCNAPAATLLTNQYFELEAELFFLRNFIDIPNSEVQELPEEKVQELLRQNFVLNKRYFTDEKVKELYDKFKKKYKGKVASTYKKCEDPDIGALKKKWNSFKENIKSLGQDTGKTIKAEWGKAINNPAKGMQGFIKGVESFRLNSIPALKTPDKIVAAMTKELNKSGGVPPSLDEAQASIDITYAQFTKTVNTTAVKAEYESLYKQGGDSLAESYVNKIKEINEVVIQTYDPLIKLKECTKKTGERQCQ